VTFTRRRYLVVFSTAVLCYAALGSVLGILPDYVHSLGGGAVLIGFAGGAPALTGAAGRPFGGRLADRHGPARVMIAGALVMAVGTIPAFVQSLPVLILSRLMVGAGEATMMVAAASAAVLGRSPDRGVAPDPDAHEHEPDPAKQRSTLRATLRPGLGLMLVNFGYVAVLSFGAAAATEQGTGIASLVLPVFGIGVILSRTLLAGVPDRFGAPRTLCAAVPLEAAGLAGMAATTSTEVALIALVVMAIGQGLAVPSHGLLARAKRQNACAPPQRPFVLA